MALKDNIDFVKNEISSEEKFLEGFVRSENFFNKYKTIIIAAVVVVIVAVVSTFLLSNIQNTVQNEDDPGEIVYYSGALQTEIYTVAAISETFDSEDWNYLSGIIDDEIGEYRNIFDFESEDFYSVEFLGNEEWEEFYKNFNNQQIL